MQRPLLHLYVIILCVFVYCSIPGRVIAQSATPPQPTVRMNGSANQVPAANTAPLELEYLGAPQGYTVISAPVQIMCVVKNVSAAAVPAGTYRLQCVPLDGLDYDTGNTLPILPALQPAQQAYVLWQLKPRDDGHPFASTAILQHIAGDPAATSTPEGVRIAVFPTLPGPAHFGLPVAGVEKGPQAGHNLSTAWIAANLIAMKIRRLSNREPIALLAAFDSGTWQTCSVLSPFLAVTSAGPGQQPWRQTFRWLSTKQSATSSSATLTLNGTCGQLWTVQLRLTALTNSSTIRADVLLTAIHNASLQAVQLPVIRAFQQSLPPADGTVHLLPTLTEQLPPTSNVSVLHIGGSLCGETWPTMPPIAGWQWRRVPTLSGMRSAGCWFTEQPALIPAGNSVEFKYRLFVHPMATSILNALAFQER